MKPAFGLNHHEAEALLADFNKRAEDAETPQAAAVWQLAANALHEAQMASFRRRAAKPRRPMDLGKVAG